MLRCTYTCQYTINLLRGLRPSFGTLLFYIPNLTYRVHTLYESVYKLFGNYKQTENLEPATGLFLFFDDFVLDANSLCFYLFVERAASIL